jgi:hypothetical protein
LLLLCPQHSSAKNADRQKNYRRIRYSKGSTGKISFEKEETAPSVDQLVDQIQALCPEISAYICMMKTQMHALAVVFLGL